MIIKEILNSVAFRSSFIYTKFLQFKRPIFKYFEKEKTDQYHLIILCGKQQIGLLQELLFSIVSNFAILPTIYIFIDQDVDLDIIIKKLKWLPKNTFQIIPFTECINYHLNKGDIKIAEFAKKNPMGLKLAAIHQLADKETPLLYCDTDVLWFKDPSKIIADILAEEETYTVMSQDFQSAYDINLIEKLNLEILLEKPFYCAGISFFKPFLKKDKVQLDQMISVAVEGSNHFTEQTIFAYFNKLNGDKSLDNSKFVMYITDQFELFPKKNNVVIARHYVGAVRHQFWRDALYMRYNYFGSKHKIE